MSAPGAGRLCNGADLKQASSFRRTMAIAQGQQHDITMIISRQGGGSTWLHRRATWPAPLQLEVLPAQQVMLPHSSLSASPCPWPLRTVLPQESDFWWIWDCLLQEDSPCHLLGCQIQAQPGWLRLLRQPYPYHRLHLMLLLRHLHVAQGPQSPTLLAAVEPMRAPLLPCHRLHHVGQTMPDAPAVHRPSAHDKTCDH